ncbi:MAG: ABC transporter permease [Oscillospiraceae bacterium]|nr:ABC transporter permease [Oscillospiraceae bacterium]
MLKYIIKRILQAIPMLIAVSIIIYALLQFMPGDPLDMYLENPNASPEVIEKMKESYGLNDPIPVQYLNWAKNLLKGDWGRSYNSRRPVLDLLAERIGPTLQLTVTAFILSVVVAIPLGIFGAIKKGKPFDYVTTTLTFLGISMPVFWFGLMLQLIFSVHLGWLPTAGRVTVGAAYSGSFLDVARHLVLPAIVLSLIYIAGWSRYARSNFLEVMNQDYIRTARAKGLKEGSVLGKHAFRNALISLITVITLDIPVLFSGAVVTEAVFSWPGMGSFMKDALDKQDYPVLMGILMINALLVILSNLLADILYAVFDPRIKYD